LKRKESDKIGMNYEGRPYGKKMVRDLGKPVFGEGAGADELLEKG